MITYSSEPMNFTISCFINEYSIPSLEKPTSQQYIFVIVFAERREKNVIQHQDKNQSNNRYSRWGELVGEELCNN